MYMDFLYGVSYKYRYHGATGYRSEIRNESWRGDSIGQQLRQLAAMTKTR